MEPLPSRSALVRIGKALAAGTETDAQLDQLDVLLGRCDEVKAGAVDRLVGALADVELESGTSLSVRGRTKTLITLREKLKRMGGHQLPVLRDLAGLRIVGDMTLAEQDDVLVIAAAALGIDQDDIKVIDRRAEPVQGYRALHGELVIEGVRVELQVRTLLQHEWAELYERAGDHLGRSIRYPAAGGASGGSDQTAIIDNILTAFHNTSGFIMQFEEISFEDIHQKISEEKYVVNSLPTGEEKEKRARILREIEEEVGDLKTEIQASGAREHLWQSFTLLGEILDVLAIRSKR